MTRFTTTGRSNPWSYDTPRSFKPMRPTYLADDRKWPLWLKLFYAPFIVWGGILFMGGM